MKGERVSAGRKGRRYTQGGPRQAQKDRGALTRMRSKFTLFLQFLHILHKLISAIKFV